MNNVVIVVVVVIIIVVITIIIYFCHYSHRLHIFTDQDWATTLHLYGECIVP